jgi:hypothetical protein
MLRRHLRIAHDLDIAQYRARWKLPADHPLTAPSYSARRSTMAKQLGFGRKPSTVDATQPAAEEVPLAEPEGPAPASNTPVGAQASRPKAKCCAAGITPEDHTPVQPNTIVSICDNILT